MVRRRKNTQFISRGIRSGLYYFPFLLFAVLLSLSFFATPAAEDLSIHYYDHVLGVKENISQFYHANCSRYFSFPLIFLLFDGRGLLEHYYVGVIAGFLAFWGVLFLLVTVADGLLFKDRNSLKWRVWLSVVVLLAICSVMFQMASIFYWISGSMTYLLSFLLFALLMIGVLSAAGRGRMSKSMTFCCVLLAIFASGTNEVTLFFLVLSLLWFQLAYYSVCGRTFRPVSLLMAVVLACFVLLIVPGGASQRAGHFRVNFSLGRGVLISIGYTGRLLVRLLSSPLVWLCMVLAGLGGSLTKEGLREKLAASRYFRPGLLVLLPLSGVAVFYFLIYIFSGELLPPRANNLLLFYIFFFFLAACFGYGLKSERGADSVLWLAGEPAVRLFVFVLFITSPLFYRGVRDIAVGIIYKKVLDNRANEIKLARERGDHRVSLHPYAEDFRVESGKFFPAMLRERIGEGNGKYPGYVYYQDPLADTGLYIHYYAQFHLIDTIHYRGGDYARIGLGDSLRRK